MATSGVSLAKKCGVIHFYEVLQSGKVGVLVDDAKKPGERKMITIAKTSDVKFLLTEDVVKMIKIRPIKKKDAPRNREDEMMDIGLLNDPTTEDSTSN